MRLENDVLVYERSCLHHMFDHIMIEDTEQDCVAVASIFEALLARFKVEYKGLEIVWVLSEKAKCD